jgi:flagellar basal-body rod protein FlgB
MINLFQSTTIPALEHSLNFSQRRHELLAGNLANMDTPGYQSRDLSVDDFHEALADSISASSDPQSVSPTTRDEIAYGPRAATEQVVFHDGSDVSMEHQVTEMAKNQHLHSLAITTMRSQFALLRAAITERA